MKTGNRLTPNRVSDRSTWSPGTTPLIARIYLGENTGEPEIFNPRRKPSELNRFAVNVIDPA
jgi:hypothetical protein